MPAEITDRFRQLVAGVTNVQGFEALMIHIRTSSSEGFCPVCAVPMVVTESVERECRYGPRCIHGKCPGCDHNSHYSEEHEPDLSSLTDEDIRSTQAMLSEMVTLLDAGHQVSIRPL